MKYTKKYTKGFSLLELMLAMVCIVAASVGAYKMFGPGSVQASVRQEQESSGRMVDKIIGAFTTYGNYSEVGTDTVAGILNVPYNASTQSISSSLRHDLQITPDRLVSPNDSFRLTYKGLDRKTCIALVPALASRSNGVFIGSYSNIQTKQGQEPDGGVISTQCASANSVDVGFRFSSDKSQFAPVGEMQSGLCAPETETQILPCPANSSGSITQRRTSTCDTTNPENPVQVWSSWVTASNTCGANATPVTPQTPVPPTNVCIPQSRMQTGSCPSGQIGSVLQQQTFNCATNTWSSWSTVSTSCQPNTTPKSCTPSARRQTVSCPNNQWGGIVQEQASTCDASGNELWNGDWKNISTTCTATCVGEGNCCTIIRDQDQARVEFCPTGQWGRLTSTWGRTSTCPSSTSTTGAQWGNWIQKTATQGSCNTCTPRDETERRDVPVNVGCPAGQTGTNSYISVQQRTRRGTFSCINGSNGTQPTTPDSWSNWTDWVQVETTNAVNTCVAVPTNTCYVMTDWSSGTSDTRDAYWSISYTVQGVPFSCSISIRDGRDPSVCTQQALSLEAWKQQAWDGETYTTSGSESGWGGGGGEFWSWDYNLYEKRSGAACGGTPPVAACSADTRSDHTLWIAQAGNTASQTQKDYGLRACNSSNIGQRSYSSYASVASGGFGGGGTFRAAICTASGWNVVAGAGSSPYTGTQPADYAALQTQGYNDAVAKGWWNPSGQNNYYITYSCQ